MKKQKPNNLARLLHIIDSINLIEEFILGYDFEKFTLDKKTFYAVLKQIEIVGEATYHITQDIKDEFDKIEWQKIEGMRHKLVHDYYDIQRELVWQVATLNIPQLKKDVQPIIDKLSSIEKE
jgi:uncharacterized protein with HEPN domain